MGSILHRNNLVYFFIGIALTITAGGCATFEHKRSDNYQVSSSTILEGGQDHPSVDKLTGKPRLSIPISALDQRSGNGYDLNLKFNGVNHSEFSTIANDTSQTSRFGLGWQLIGTKNQITRVHKNSKITADDDYIMFFNGEMYHLEPTGEIEFDDEDQQLSRAYLTKNNLTNWKINYIRAVDEQNEYWQLIDDQGSVYQFGGDDDEPTYLSDGDNSPDQQSPSYRAFAAACSFVGSTRLSERANGDTVTATDPSGRAQTDYQAHDCAAGATEYAVAWNNWMGPRHDTENQASFATAWNLASVTDVRGLTTNLHYLQHVQAVGQAVTESNQTYTGYLFNKASYLYKVSYQSGDYLLLNYCQRTAGSTLSAQGFSSSAISPMYSCPKPAQGQSYSEYTDNKTISTKGEPDGFQERYDVLYLGSIDAYTGVLDGSDATDFGFALQRTGFEYQFLVPSSYADDSSLAKRMLMAVAKYRCTGSNQCNYTSNGTRIAADHEFDYWGMSASDNVSVSFDDYDSSAYNEDNGGDFVGAYYGALKQVSYPEGKTLTYRYAPVTLTGLTRHIANYDSNMSNRQAVFSQDYVLMVGNRNGALSIDAYHWTSNGWVEHLNVFRDTKAMPTSNYTNWANLHVKATTNFFAVYPPSGSGIQVFYKDELSQSNWLKSQTPPVLQGAAEWSWDINDRMFVSMNGNNNKSGFGSYSIYETQDNGKNWVLATNGQVAFGGNQQTESQGGNATRAQVGTYYTSLYSLIGANASPAVNGKAAIGFVFRNEDGQWGDSIVKHTGLDFGAFNPGGSTSGANSTVVLASRDTWQPGYLVPSLSAIQPNNFNNNGPMFQPVMVSHLPDTIPTSADEITTNTIGNGAVSMSSTGAILTAFHNDGHGLASVLCNFYTYDPINLAYKQVQSYFNEKDKCAVYAKGVIDNTMLYTYSNSSMEANSTNPDTNYDRNYWGFVPESGGYTQVSPQSSSDISSSASEEKKYQREMKRLQMTEEIIGMALLGLPTGPEMAPFLLYTAATQAAAAIIQEKAMQSTKVSSDMHSMGDGGRYLFERNLLYKRTPSNSIQITRVEDQAGSSYGSGVLWSEDDQKETGEKLNSDYFGVLYGYAAFSTTNPNASNNLSVYFQPVKNGVNLGKHVQLYKHGEPDGVGNNSTEHYLSVGGADKELGPVGSQSFFITYPSHYDNHNYSDLYGLSSSAPFYLNAVVDDNAVGNIIDYPVAQVDVRYQGDDSSVALTAYQYDQVTATYNSTALYALTRIYPGTSYQEVTTNNAGDYGKIHSYQFNGSVLASLSHDPIANQIETCYASGDTCQLTSAAALHRWLLGNTYRKEYYQASATKPYRVETDEYTLQEYSREFSNDDWSAPMSSAWKPLLTKHAVLQDQTHHQETYTYNDIGQLASTSKASSLPIRTSGSTATSVSPSYELNKRVITYAWESDSPYSESFIADNRLHDQYQSKEYRAKTTTADIPPSYTTPSTSQLTTSFAASNLLSMQFAFNGQYYCFYDAKGTYEIDTIANCNKQGDNALWRYHYGGGGSKNMASNYSSTQYKYLDCIALQKSTTASHPYQLGKQACNSTSKNYDLRFVPFPSNQQPSLPSDSGGVPMLLMLSSNGWKTQYCVVDSNTEANKLYVEQCNLHDNQVFSNALPFLPIIKSATNDKAATQESSAQVSELDNQSHTQSKKTSNQDQDEDTPAWVEVSSTVTVYNQTPKADGSEESLYLPSATYVANTENPEAFSTDSDQWTQLSNIAQRDSQLLLPIEVQDMTSDGRIDSHLISDNQHGWVIATARNASFEQGQVWYAGFEPYEQTAWQTNNAQVSSQSTNTHTGHHALISTGSMSLSSKTTLTKSSEVPTVISAWVYHETNSNACTLYGDDDQQIKSSVAGQWQLLELELTPSNSNTAYLEGEKILSCSNGSIVDDVRFYPADSRLTINVYDGTYYVKKAQINSNSTTQYWAYDSYLRPYVSYVESLYDQSKQASSSLVSATHLSPMNVSAWSRFSGYNLNYSDNEGGSDYSSSLPNSHFHAKVQDSDSTIIRGAYQHNSNLLYENDSFLFRALVSGTADVTVSNLPYIRWGDVRFAYEPSTSGASSGSYSLQSSSGNNLSECPATSDSPLVSDWLLVRINKSAFFIGDGKLLWQCHNNVVAGSNSAGDLTLSTSVQWSNLIVASEATLAANYLDGGMQTQQHHRLHTYVNVDNQTEQAKDTQELSSVSIAMKINGWRKHALITKPIEYSCQFLPSSESSSNSCNSNIDKQLLNYRSNLGISVTSNGNATLNGDTYNYYKSGPGSNLISNTNDPSYAFQAIKYKQEPTARIASQMVAPGASFSIESASELITTDYDDWSNSISSNSSLTEYGSANVYQALFDETSHSQTAGSASGSSTSSISQQINDQFGRSVYSQAVTSDGSLKIQSANSYNFNLTESGDFVAQQHLHFQPNAFSNVANAQDYWSQYQQVDVLGRDVRIQRPDVFNASGQARGEIQHFFDSAKRLRFYQTNPSNSTSQGFAYRKYDTHGRLTEVGTLKDVQLSNQSYLSNADNMDYPNSSQACWKKRYIYDENISSSSSKNYNGRLYKAIENLNIIADVPSDNCLADTSTDPQGSSEVAYKYDDFGRVMAVSETLRNSSGKASSIRNTAYQYNNLNQITQSAYPTVNQANNGEFVTNNQTTVSNDYDALSRLNSVSVASNKQAQLMVYDTEHNLLSQTLANNIVENYTYNFQNRLLSKKVINQDDQTTLYSETLSYNKLQPLCQSNLTSFYDRGYVRSSANRYGASASSTGEAYDIYHCYGYDGFGRLVAEKIYNTSSSTLVSKAYEYDSNGNLLSVSSNGNNSDERVYQTVAGANRLNQVQTSNQGQNQNVQSFNYNARGSATSIPSFDQTINANVLSIDPKSQQVMCIENEGHEVEFQYDALGRRITKQVQNKTYATTAVPTCPTYSDN